MRNDTRWSLSDNNRTQVNQPSNSPLRLRAADDTFGPQLPCEAKPCRIEQSRQSFSAKLWMNDQPIDGSYRPEKFVFAGNQVLVVRQLTWQLVNTHSSSGHDAPLVHDDPMVAWWS
jgi:hypothetical protein